MYSIVNGTYCYICQKDFTEHVISLGPDFMGFHEMMHMKHMARILYRLDRLNRDIAECANCSLCKDRNSVVPGSGNIYRPDIMFIGEAPGQDEDETGIPFVGRAGKLLTKMIRALGYERHEVFITNVVKCRPPNNRDPRPEERLSCSIFLETQISLIQPYVIVTLGLPAAKAIIGLPEETRMGDVRGKLYDYAETPVIPTYHPAYLLRNPGAKKTVWNDLQTAMEQIKIAKGESNGSNY